MTDCIDIKLDTNESQAVIKIESPAVEKHKEAENMINIISVLSKNLGGTIENIIINKNRHLQQISIPFSLIDGVVDLQEDSLNEH